MIAAQRPVIVSRGGEFPALLAAARCAIVVARMRMPSRAASTTIVDPRTTYAAMARRGRELIESELNWDVIGQQLDDVLHRAAS